MEQQQPSFLRASAELLNTLLKSIIIAFALILFVVQASDVEGTSMEPNLHTGQRVMIDKITYEFSDPQRGDVVVVKIVDSEIPLIKRVIALAGETVEIRNGIVFVNGVQLDEPYLQNVNQQNYGPVLVSAEHIFVMGDNRPVSRDSRSFGPVDIYRVIGRARLRVWPPEDFGLLR